MPAVPPAPAGAPVPVAFSRPLLGLITAQVCVHSAMAGVRLAVPLQALAQGAAEWVVGVLLAMFALAPVLLALPAGRLADRHGYHRPLRLAVMLACGGALVAAASQFLIGPVAAAQGGMGRAAHLLLLAVAATAVGSAANIGLIAVQRTAGHMARNPTERMRVFSWLGLAPAVANVVGPVLAGGLIDLAGYGAAFGAMAALPLAALAASRWVPRERVGPLPSSIAAAPSAIAGRTSTPSSASATTATAPRPSLLAGARELVMQPGMRRLLLMNWMISASWDVHSFAVPVLGHERGLSASAIGAVLGVFAAAVAAIRLAIPLIAHRLSEARCLRLSMLLTGAVFAVYPFTTGAWAMGLCAAVLGMALGAVQPMIMSSLHRLTPAHRHGEAIALRSMTINAASTAMPMLFGVAGAALGAATVFWAMGAIVGSGSALAGGLARRLQARGR